MRDTGSEKINIEIPRGRGERLEKHSFEIEKVREGRGGEGGRRSNFLQTGRQKKKKKNCVSLIAKEKQGPPRSPSDAEESGNGSPCYRHPFETSDTSDKRRGMEANSPRRGGRSAEEKVKENGNSSEFFRSSSSYTSPLPHWVNTVLSVPFFNHPSSFLSFRSLFMRANRRFDSVPGHPRDPFSLFGSPPALDFSGIFLHRIVQFFIYLFILLSLETILLSFFRRIR